jgi:hypothetical protein
MPFQFPPLLDKKRFPILASLSKEPGIALMCCDELTFFASSDTAVANYATRMPGVEWHLYGDTRWPSRSTWVEFPLTNHIRGQSGGVLVARSHIPPKQAKPLDWAAANHPLAKLLPGMGVESNVRRIAEMLRSQEVSDQTFAGPNDQRPGYVHGYCICRKKDSEEETQFVATYTDILNAAGVPIPRFRMGEFKPEDLSLCQFSLHALFRLNAARLDGAAFSNYSQVPAFVAARLEGDAVPPKWFNFHPSRTLRTRPALRRLPLPDLVDGILEFSDFEKILDVRRREVNAHMLAFERVVRPRDMVLMNVDSNSSMAAFMHRAHGGAIYVIPDKLVEEFHHTDCSEVRMGDITLPFSSVFLKFTPPHAIKLAENAHVDGCYLAKQGEEFLLTLTARLNAVDYANSVSVACVDPIYSLHLPTSDAEIAINDAVELGIEDFLAKNAPPEEDASMTVERSDGTVAHAIDVRAKSRKRRIEVFRSQEPAFRACLNIIINAACFITFRPDDITDGWEGEPPGDIIAAALASAESRRSRDKKLGALRKIEDGDFTRVKICGRDLFTDRQQAKGESQGKSPRAHWRRGHWRRQRHGVGLALVGLRWIRPTIVKKDNGQLVEARIYEV